MESNLDESCDDDVDIVAILANKINWNQSMSACKPLEKPQLSNKMHTSYQKEILCKIKDAAANDLLPSMIPTKTDDGCEIIEQLKEKFHASTVAVRK